MNGDLKPRRGQRVEERHEAPFHGRELRARLLQPENGEVELRAARELGQVVSRHARRILPPPPGVDRLRVRLHQARERREPIRRVRREGRRPSAPDCRTRRWGAGRPATASHTRSRRPRAGYADALGSSRGRGARSLTHEGCSRRSPAALPETSETGRDDRRRERGTRASPAASSGSRHAHGDLACSTARRDADEERALPADPGARRFAR